MLLDFNKSEFPMRKVYSLIEELRSNPGKVKLVQDLTRDSNRPLGLSGRHGLYGSSEWWENIRKGLIQTEKVSGVIKRMYVSGQEPGGTPDTFDMLCDDGLVRMESCYVDAEADLPMFKIGCRVEALYALDELKQQPAKDGGINYSRIALEMAVSVLPVE